MTAHWLTTTRADGDLRIDEDPATLAERRRGVVDRPWVWLRQVHGATVVIVDEADDAAPAATGAEADALVTSRADVALAVHTADCGPVVFDSDEGVIGVAHAGWRGLEAGVIDATVDAMRGLGATRIDGWLGPCIGPECYEFGAIDLDRLATRFGDDVRARTAAGAPALDLRSAVRLAAARAGVSVAGEPVCTACDPEGRYFSHRARAETARMATVVWREDRS